MGKLDWRRCDLRTRKLHFYDPRSAYDQIVQQTEKKTPLSKNTTKTVRVCPKCESRNIEISSGNKIHCVDCGYLGKKTLIKLIKVSTQHVTLLEFRERILANPNQKRRTM